MPLEIKYFSKPLLNCIYILGERRSIDMIMEDKMDIRQSLGLQGSHNTPPPNQSSSYSIVFNETISFPPLISSHKTCSRWHNFINIITSNSPLYHYHEPIYIPPHTKSLPSPKCQPTATAITSAAYRNGCVGPSREPFHVTL